jgi:hypothetical protein
MQNLYAFQGHPVVRLPERLTWSEDPFSSDNWLFQYHSLGFVLVLTDAWKQTGDAQYRDRAVYLLSSWLRSNPHGRPASDQAWEGHATALRALVLVCAAKYIGWTPWLTRGIELHGRVLADHRFYRGSNNPALNQGIALLDVGCALRRRDWSSLAALRLNRLVARSVDAQGVTNERAISYQIYNFVRYRLARARLRACKKELSAAFSRLDLMPRFLAHATQPDGRYVMIGDTSDQRAVRIRGTVAEFAATRGVRGPRPANEIAVYQAGYAFGRTGWGERVPIANETMFSFRFGPSRRFHGHDDAGSVTLYGGGSRLLLDPGYRSYDQGSWRTFFQSAGAHNVVTVDGYRPAPRGMKLVRSISEANSYEAVAVTTTRSPVRWSRRLIFSRSLGYLVVEDRLHSARRRTFRQLWHLREDSRPRVSGQRIRTRRSSGNVVILQIRQLGKTRIVTGRMRPRQGWTSYQYREVLATPVVEQTVSWRSARYLTLLVPFGSGSPEVRASNLKVTPNGFSLIVSVYGRRERIVANKDRARITVLEKQSARSH